MPWRASFNTERKKLSPNGLLSDEHVEQIVGREPNQRACKRQLACDVVARRRVNSDVRPLCSMHDKMLLVIALTISLAFIGCHASSGKLAQSPSPEPIPGDTLITLERIGGFGTGRLYKLTITSDGRVNYESPIKTPNRAEKQLTQSQVSELVAAFNAANYFSLNDRYAGTRDGCPANWTDAPYATTSLRLNGKSKTILHYYGCRELDSPGHAGGVWPSELFQLEKRIDEIVGTDKWIK